MLYKIIAEPTSKARPKTIFRNGKVWTYTPKGTKDAECELKLLIKSQLRKFYPPHMPIKLSVVFYRTKPDWTPPTDKLPVRKPDLDNYIKSVLDSLDKIAFPDDAQVTTIEAKKRWSDNGAGYITIELLEDKL